MSNNTITLEELTALANTTWEKQQEKFIPHMRQSKLFNESEWGRNTGDTRMFNELDTEKYAKNKSQGNQARQMRVQVGYEKLATLVRRGSDAIITWELRNRGKYPEINKELTDMSKTVPERMELDLSHRFSFGTATSYVDMDGVSVDISVGDGLALFATAHTVRASSQTYRNRLANNPQLSRGAMENMENLIATQTFNQFGQKQAGGDFDTLWVTDDPTTANTAMELMQSTARIDAPNAGVVNTYKAKYNVVVLPLIATDAMGVQDSTKSKYWGIASTSLSSAYFAIEQEPTMNHPAIGNNAEDVSTEDWTYTARGSYSICIVSGKWIKMSSGDGQP
jgi:hypothetical protein